MSDEACLLDSNILLRMEKSDDPHYPVIRGAIDTLVAEGSRLCCTSQTLGEFWNASTRPIDKNGFGLTVTETDVIARVIERLRMKWAATTIGTRIHDLTKIEIGHGPHRPNRKSHTAGGHAWHYQVTAAGRNVSLPFS